MATPKPLDLNTARMGSFVTADPGLGVGRLVEAGASTSRVRYFRGPIREPYVDLDHPTAEVRPARLGLNSRVFFLQRGHWRVGRIDALPGRGDVDFVVALPNSEGALLPQEALEIRWCRPIEDPFAFLLSGGTESPLLADVRTSLLAGWRAQRAASHGAEGIWLSSVELHPHQISAVRRVAADPIRRYLLADEVGLGKTIEAGGVIRQSMDGGVKRTLVLVPDHLRQQWETELVGRFHLPVGATLQILGHTEVALWSAAAPDLLVIDEAHHLTRAGAVSPQTRLKAHDLAIAASQLLLLTATPVRSNEAGFLDLLSMLDPVQYRPEQLDEFVRRVDARDELALIHRSLESVEDVFEFTYLADQLRELFPSDGVLADLIRIAEASDDALLANCALRIRSHLSETYRLHHRMIRTRRTPELTNVFGVRGRRRGRPFTLEVSDQGDALRLDLLEFLRSRLAGALDDGHLTSSEAIALFREWAARCGSLPVALKPLACELRAQASESPDDARWLALSDSERIADLADRVVSSWTGFEPGFVAALSSLVMSKRAGRVVISSAFTESTVAAFGSMQERWGSHRVALHSMWSDREENDAAVERWRTDPTCSLLFCDAGAEEGVNLQDADLLVHLDLPWQTPRLEQRLGRCDRYREGVSDPISSVVLTYGDQPFSSQWFEFVADAAHVFDKSVSALQYVLVDVEQEFVELAIRGGPAAMAGATPDFESRLAQESVRISAQDALDGVSMPSDDAPLAALDRDRGFGHALTTWLEGVGCGVKHVRPGVVVLQPRGRVQVPFELEMAISRCLKVPLALSREAAVSNKIEILRAGHPLVDAIAAHLSESDRGVASAMFRPAKGIWPPRVVARADVLSVVDRAQVLDVVGPSTELAQRVLDLCAELLPARLDSVWFFPDGEEVTHPSVLRAYSREGGDINLGSRPDAFDSFISHVDWESLCATGAEVALRLVRSRSAEALHRTAQIEMLLGRVLTEVDQRKARVSAGMSGDEWTFDDVVYGNLERTLVEPRRTVVSAGAVFLGDPHLAGLS
jgi:ATP-dependent helicase HepA